tara:strand:- start:15133 stop:16140 length:1008 start_codon:yes stop_codon:yes gene_type:complete
MFSNKNVLVTGGTGSFGSAFVKNLLTNFKPKKVVVLSRGEDRQRKMQENLKGHKNLRFFIGDVRDKDRLKVAFMDMDYVIHAAALKQVPAAEYNPLECIKTNINGAENVINAVLETKVSKVLALSTDKAVNPVNLYGASKLASDKLFISANNYVGKPNKIFSVVRYGNVSGSTGSVIPVFKKLLENKSKFFPITDAKMTRFWITLEHAVEFVNESFQRMRGGEIFVPKIPSFRITDLAKAMGHLKIKIVGIRPGEKIHEVLTAKDESHLVIQFKDYLIITPTISSKKKINIYRKSKTGEKGKFVDSDFFYSSDTNKNFLHINDLKSFVKKFNYDK